MFYGKGQLSALYGRKIWGVKKLRGFRMPGSDLLSLRAPVLENVYALSYPGVDPIGVETVFGEEQFRITVRNQTVGNAHAHQSYSVL